MITLASISALPMRRGKGLIRSCILLIFLLLPVSAGSQTEVWPGIRTEEAYRIPMWIADKIYFCSDRDRTLNIYSYQVKSGVVEQLTKHKDYDVRRPGYGGNKIVYELG